ncbi:hypothetical protein M422DRAFT_253745 [Sphaerobolus stellatus SS14]|uniref:DUF6534 domain-containing protein n=1 Tax=Sphaerobolus stellatus (strain SS14) TaxID=990650 RepID=A0A0C9V7I3_SPHS4|nr:hypothetical protein M422DRAFT_253745 [Sphaerobolus stellatus SS14]
MSDEVKTLIEPALSLYLGAISVAFSLYQSLMLEFSVATSVCAIFYILRVWFVSGHKTWLAGIMIALSILQLGLIIFLVLGLYGKLMTKLLGTGIGQYSLDAIPASLSGLLLKLHFTLTAMAYIIITRSISSVYASETLITQGVAFTSTILCDALISGSLVYFLRKKPLHRSMRMGIGKITVYSINIGLVTVAVSTISLITEFAAPHSQFTWEIFYYPAAPIYVNSVLVSLNARKEIRAQMIKGYSRPHSSMFMSFNVDDLTTTTTFKNGHKNPAQQRTAVRGRLQISARNLSVRNYPSRQTPSGSDSARDSPSTHSSTPMAGEWEVWLETMVTWWRIYAHIVIVHE